MPIYKTKTALYFISWAFKILALLLLKKARKTGIISKVVFYFIYFQRKAHFIIFGISMISGLHLSCRTLLHMRMIFSDFDLFLDKIVSVLFVILLSTDFLGIIYFPFY